MTGNDVVFYSYISGLSFVIFLGLFLFCPWISKIFSSKYMHLAAKDQVNWDTRIGSNIHAVVATAISLYAFFFDQSTLLDHFCTDSVIVRSGISITFGYILADFLVIVWYYRYFQDKFMVIHHIMALLAYIFVIVDGYILFFANIRQIAELSTPFVNQRWFYDITGQPRSSKAFIRNGLLMILAFFLGRIIFIPYFYYKTFSVWFYPQRLALGPLLSLIWILTAGILDIINVYWFSKMLKGGAKLLMKSGGEKKSE
ncbi:transmembrane protein 56-like [Dendronephthya gigantea]|uniref:transmembrane protein 56-like n=1 Tax=Dendronephthya gigantea TaxID=151771 RepID=UPI00106AFAD0|nr:transmembrane protein 56-like [Dendronephthya gigantea]XP_028413077.1 transmembrane protein 56-like [Dendronephthya gigantea]